MISRFSRISKAIAAALVPLAALVADLLLQASEITEDGAVEGEEWKLLVLAVVAGVVTYFAPKNTEPA